MTPERLAFGGDDARDGALEPRVERRLHAPGTAAVEALDHPFHEVRRDHGRPRTVEVQPFVARGDQLFRRYPAAIGHRGQNAALTIDGPIGRLPGIESAWLLRKSGKERGLRGGERRDVPSEVRGRGPPCALDLIAVGGEVQVEREDLALCQPVLESHGHDRFADLCPPSTSSAGRLPSQEQFGDLLSQRRTAFDDAAGADVADRRARDRDRIDPGVPAEAPVFGGFGRSTSEGAEARRLQSGCLSAPQPIAPRTAARHADRPRGWMDVLLRQGGPEVAGRDGSRGEGRRRS